MAMTISTERGNACMPRGRKPEPSRARRSARSTPMLAEAVRLMHATLPSTATAIAEDYERRFTRMAERRRRPFLDPRRPAERRADDDPHALANLVKHDGRA